LGGRNRRIMFEEWPGKKLARPYLKHKLSVVVYICVLSYSGGRGRRIEV
jgi:hypothetical protein